MHMCVYKNASVHVYCITEHVGVCVCTVCLGIHRSIPVCMYMCA